MLTKHKCTQTPQIKQDCAFLESQNVTGYSLVLGIHERQSEQTKTQNDTRSKFSAHIDSVIQRTRELERACSVSRASSSKSRSRSCSPIGRGAYDLDRARSQEVTRISSLSRPEHRSKLDRRSSSPEFQARLRGRRGSSTERSRPNRSISPQRHPHLQHANLSVLSLAATMTQESGAISCDLVLSGPERNAMTGCTTGQMRDLPAASKKKSELRRHSLSMCEDGKVSKSCSDHLLAKPVKEHPWRKDQRFSASLPTNLMLGQPAPPEEEIVPWTWNGSKMLESFELELALDEANKSVRHPQRLSRRSLSAPYLPSQ